MITRRTTLLVLAAAFSMVATQSLAEGRSAFDRAAFDAEASAGRPILIEIGASWCSTCRQQRTIVTELMKKPEYAAFRVFEVDFDTEKDIMRSFGAQQLSTLIVFKGDVEVGRIVGDTRWTSIDALLAGAL